MERRGEEMSKEEVVFWQKREREREREIEIER